MRTASEASARRILDARLTKNWAMLRSSLGVFREELIQRIGSRNVTGTAHSGLESRAGEPSLLTRILNKITVL
jgi:hypothetical protein